MGVGSGDGVGRGVIKGFDGEKSEAIFGCIHILKKSRTSGPHRRGT